jgi:vancomycin permeability regulator SanA
VKGAISVLARLSARAIALVVALVLLVGLIGEVRGRATDLSLWLVDVGDLPPIVAWPILAAIAVVLVGWAAAREPSWRRRSAGAIASATLALLAGRDVIRYGDAVAHGFVHPTAPVPLSLALAVLAAILAVVIARDRGLGDVPPRTARLLVAAATTLVAVAYPVAQIAFFGTTDYRRPAEAAVVLGARVYGNGVPSPLLADRIAAGIELYRAGLVPVLVMSGGDGADGWNEADVMRSQAMASGVPGDAILVDRTGVNTEATVDHTIALLDARAGRATDGAVASGARRIIVVSQAYHLPRVQLAYSEAGVDVITVPAIDPVPIQDMPLLVAREIPAFWVYYLRAGLGG